ncbi:LOW QUALITY PROTEIN: lysophospholipase D GDPD3-like, partial [Anser cygnoides]|uniref:LOW QUALITY PROTEIN: lysophospholipase D GDPD3-like n=1 Tax=Anser cygnoides TaxID=8845 RepID=UPI0034D2DB98
GEGKGQEGRGQRARGRGFTRGGVASCLGAWLQSWGCGFTRGGVASTWGRGLTRGAWPHTWGRGLDLGAWPRLGGVTSDLGAWPHTWGRGLDLGAWPRRPAHPLIRLRRRLENTMEAFENAVAQGAELLELDCRRTRDGAVVLSHDRGLRRQAGLDRDLRDLAYEELPPYKETLEVTFAPGCYSRGRDRRMPRLDEVFARFPHVAVSVEIKDDDDELIQQVAELVRRHDRAAITLWASFDDRILRKCRAAHPGMPYGFSPRRALWCSPSTTWGCCRCCPWGRRRCWDPCPASSTGRISRCPKGILGQALALLADKFIMTKGLLQHLRERDIQVVLWVLNEECDFADAFARGASGVMTDYPGRLRRYLDAHPRPDRYRPVQTATERYRPVQTSTDQYKPLQTTTTH